MILYEKKNSETGKEYAYRVLKENIMSLELKPGELLSEGELAQQLNISRTPIREVLMRLKNEYLIEVKPQTGTYVSLLDIDLIDQGGFMRLALEEKVLREACEDFPTNLLIELEKNLYAQKILCDMEQGDREFHKLDNQFHEIIFTGVKKQEVWNSILNMSTHYNRMRLLAQVNNPKKDIVKHHEKYLNTIKNKLVENIDELLGVHLEDARKSWDELITNNEEIAKYLKKR